MTGLAEGHVRLGRPRPRRRQQMGLGGHPAALVLEGSPSLCVTQTAFCGACVGRRVLRPWPLLRMRERGTPPSTEPFPAWLSAAGASGPSPFGLAGKGTFPRGVQRRRSRGSRARAGQSPSCVTATQCFLLAVAAAGLADAALEGRGPLPASHLVLSVFIPCASHPRGILFKPQRPLRARTFVRLCTESRRAGAALLCARRGPEWLHPGGAGARAAPPPQAAAAEASGLRRPRPSSRPPGLPASRPRL